MTLRARIEAKAAKVGIGRADTVIANVYRFLDHRRNTVTRGEIVVPGTETKRQFPKTARFPFYFKKTFTPASAPIKRGETPEIEFAKTLKIFAALPKHVPEPLGHSEWNYRSAVVLGQTFGALSPFSDLSYEDALELPVRPEGFRDHAHALIRGCGLIGELHRAGFVHGDLHLENLMRRDDDRIMLIDLAASRRMDDLHPNEAADAQADDFSELYRDLILVQFHIGRIESGPAQQCIELIGALFPPEIAVKLEGLGGSD